MEPQLLYFFLYYLHIELSHLIEQLEVIHLVYHYAIV